MDLNSLAAVDLIKRKVRWLNANHEVVSRNIANANTPGFRAQVLEPFDVKKELRLRHQLTVESPDTMHMDGTLSRVRSPKSRPDPFPYETSPTGNSVVLEQQLIAMSKNTHDYDVATNLYKKTTGLIRTALGR